MDQALGVLDRVWQILAGIGAEGWIIVVLAVISFQLMRIAGQVARFERMLASRHEEGIETRLNMVIYELRRITTAIEDQGRHTAPPVAGVPGVAGSAGPSPEAMRVVAVPAMAGASAAPTEGARTAG